MALAHEKMFTRQQLDTAKAKIRKHYGWAPDDETIEITDKGVIWRIRKLQRQVDRGAYDHHSPRLIDALGTGSHRILVEHLVYEPPEGLRDPKVCKSELPPRAADGRVGLPLRTQDDDLRIVLLEALETLLQETGRDAEVLFGERSFDPDRLSPRSAHAMGTIDGAALALGVTALELLDELGLP